MKNLVKIIAVLVVFSPIALNAMGGDLRSAAPGTGTAMRAYQHSNKEFVELSRNRNRTPEQEARFQQLKAERQQNVESLREGGIFRHIRRGGL